MTEQVEYRRQQVREGAVPIATKILQGIGGIVESHKEFAFSTFLLLYYSQILGLSASLVSLVLAVGLVIDAVTDPIVGSITDNFKSRWGRRHLFMIGAAIPLGLSIYFLFAPPAGLSDGLLLGWLGFWMATAGLAFTFFMIPWSAIAAEFSNDYVERTSILTYRWLARSAGGMAFTLFAWSYLFPNTAEYPAGQLNPAHYPTFGLVVCCLVIFWALAASFGTKKEIRYLLQPVKPTPRFSFVRTFDEVMLALTSANFRLMFAVIILFAGIFGVAIVFDIYMTTYFWEFTPDELRWFSLVVVGAVLSFVTISRIQRVIDKHTVIVWSLVILVVLAMMKVCFRFWDIWPENGDPMLLYLLVAHGMVQMYFGSALEISFGSLIADLMDEQDFHTGRRQEGVFSAALSLGSKASSSVAIIIGGFLLDYVIAFPKQAEIGSVDDSTLFLMALNVGIVIPLLLFVPIYLITRMTMTRARLVEIQKALQERRGTDNSTSSQVGGGSS